MKYGSVCSGIEAATVAWHPLGWKPSFFSEIEKFPRQVLSHHYPDVPLHGDFTTIEKDMYEPVDLLCGGTPCQSFSIAGLRKGLADGRGNLSLEFIRLAKRLDARWLVWENVPGVLSSNDGRDFGTFLGGLAECGYGFAYRVLDAQYFGVPQRRRRVILVGYIGDWRPAAAVLFERESLCRDLTPIREARQDVAAYTAGSIGGYSEGCGTLRSNGGDIGGGGETLIAATLRASFVKPDGSNRALSEQTLIPIAFTARDYGADASNDLAPTMRSMSETNGHQSGSHGLAVALPPLDFQDSRRLRRRRQGLSRSRRKRLHHQHYGRPTLVRCDARAKTHTD